MTLPSSVRDALPANVTEAAAAAVGNTYKNMYEKTAMNSGLSFVVLVNIVVAWLGVLFYRYVILREAGLLSPEEVHLLKKYPTVRAAQSYTPTDAYVRAPPPMRWTGWPNFFTASETALSKDAQVYLLFQRACILTTAICALFASVLLLPSYWFGGAVFETDRDKAPRSLLSLLKSDRGVFERFTSHNLPSDSPLVMLQLPVFVVTAMCIIVMYTVVKAAAGEQRSVSEWLQGSSSTPVATPTPSLDTTRTPTTPTRPGKASSTPRPRQKTRSYWTLFARGLPQDVHTASEIVQLFEAIYPNQVVNVELVCKGRTSEARLLRALSSARNRLDYLYDTPDDDTFRDRQATQTLFGRIFGMFTPRRTREELIRELEQKIVQLRNGLEAQKVEPVRDFVGCAFVSFRSAAAARSALNDFPVRFESNSSSFTVTEAGHYDELTIGRHDRVSSDWGFPRLRSLYKGTVNLLPYRLRERVMSSTIAPSHLQQERRAHQQLLETIREEGDYITAEVATSRLRNMKAERAPKSGDIIWKNIGLSFFERTVREMIVQVIVFAILILFTSPVAMLTALKLVFAEVALLSDPAMIFGNATHHNLTFNPHGIPFNQSNGLAFFNLSTDDANAAQTISEDFLSLLPKFLTSNTILRSALLNYLPVLTLSIIFAAVPSVLRLTCALEGYPTHSAQEMSVFRKTSFYYVMNAVVLPSLALNTASEFLAMVYKQSGGGAHVYDALPILQRLFSGDIAFFLCTYLVQLALTGSVFWLMRIPSSVSMMVRRRMALTPLEAAEAKCTDIFDYPRHYAYSVTVMSMCLLFGFMAPLIWWFALSYFVCKHLVDLYTIRYVHPLSHIDGRLPRLGSDFILTWTTVSQLSLAVIFYLQGWVRAGVATAFLCILTLACCLSVNAHVGNRIMRLIATLRDRAINRMIEVWVDRYWMPSPSLVTSSSTSSSTQSFPGSSENDALLNKPHSERMLSASEIFESRLWGEEPAGSSSERLDRTDDDTDAEHRQQKSHGHEIGDPVTTDSYNSGSEEGDSDAEIVMLERDVEDGRTRRVLQYGTCETSRMSKNVPSP